MIKKDKNWYKLDNAAKIFPPTSTKKNPKVFRFACELYEKIDSKALQEALDLTLEEYPYFLSSLKKGLFWYYLETSSVKPIVRQEDHAICDKLDKELLFRVSYYNRRINLEVYHALTDGTGTLAFLKSLVTNYLVIKHNIKDKIILDTTSIYEKESDSFEKYYQKNDKIDIPKSEKTYILKGNKYSEERLRIIEGVVSTKDVVALSKKYNTTVTVYLTSILIKSIGQNMSNKEKKKPVIITIPVNLRKYFKSNTARNFFNTIFVKYQFTNDNDELDKIIKEIDRQFKENLAKEKISYQMNSLAGFENIFLIRLVPVFIKDIVLKYFNYKNEIASTMTLSNIGIVEIPNQLQKYIKLFDVCASTNTIQMCMCSYLDNMVLSFTSHFANAEIQKCFFEELTNNGISVIINSNKVGDD